MRKLLEFGRKAMFYVRVISGYEERRIRSYRLQLEQRLRLAQERKEAVKRIPEQLILSEVRKMVDEMQNLNKNLQDMEVNINEYFKPIDKEVDAIMNMQMEKEKAKTEMLGTIYKQTMLEKAEQETRSEAAGVDKAKMETMRTMFKHALLENAEKEAVAEINDSQNQTKASSTSSSHQAQVR